MKTFFIKISMIITALLAFTVMTVSAQANTFVPGVEKEQVFTSKIEDQTSTIALIESRTWYRMLTKVKMCILTTRNSFNISNTRLLPA